jgi:hypothetical protein
MTQAVVAVPRLRSAATTGVRSRPRLHVARREYAGRVGVFVVLATIFTLVSAVVFHVVLAQGQLELDHLTREMSVARRAYEQRRLQTSMLASPQRIVQEAQRLGLVIPTNPPTYLEVPGAPALSSQGGETATTLGDWKKVKPHLGDEP